MVIYMLLSSKTNSFQTIRWNYPSEWLELSLPSEGCIATLSTCGILMPSSLSRNSRILHFQWHFLQSPTSLELQTEPRFSLFIDDMVIKVSPEASEVLHEENFKTIPQWILIIGMWEVNCWFLLRSELDRPSSMCSLLILWTR